MKNCIKNALGLAGMALACFGLAGLAQAQSSVVCDPAGDAVYGQGKGGPAVPPWLDIIQSKITAGIGGDILFTLTVAAPIPVAPAWGQVDDGGQLWWGWGFVGDFTTDTVIKNGCLHSEGNGVPAGYLVNLIWDVSTSSFHARLLDNTSCVQSEIPFSFSPDRTEFTLVVSKSLLINTVLIPNPDTFQYYSATAAWKANSTGNLSEIHFDFAPDQSNGNLVVATWSSSSNTSYSCP